MRTLSRRTLDEGVAFLRAHDARLGAWIDRVGRIPLRRQPHRFTTLCRSIVSQQLSAAAARTIWNRLLELVAPAPRPTPERVLRLPTSKLRACGLSERKAAYVRALAKAFLSGPLHRAPLARRTDEEVVALLTELPGIGVWTAEMFLIFALGRLDVFSIGDAALRNAVERVEERELPPDEIAAIAAERWSPYRSVASLYLWRIAHWRDEEAR